MLLYTLAFIGLALALSYMSLAGAGISGFAGFGRTAASLINLVLLIIPLMALTVGAQSLAHEAEQGTLAYLLAQPVTRAEVFAGKYLGLAMSLLASLALALYGVIFILATMIIGLLLAIFIDQKVAGEGVLRTVFLYPYAMSFVATGLVWALDRFVLARRRAAWTQPAPRYTRGLLAKYTKLVSTASKGAITDGA